jgi:hypothetical protein
MNGLIEEFFPGPYAACKQIIRINLSRSKHSLVPGGGERHLGCTVSLCACRRRRDSVSHYKYTHASARLCYLGATEAGHVGGCQCQMERARWR